MRRAQLRLGMVAAALSRLFDLAVLFFVSSVLSVGGTNAVVPHLKREIVGANGWLSDMTFAQIYALAQVIPGPSTMIATLLGQQIAGLPGALVATVAMVVPSCVLAFAICRVWEASGPAAWHEILQEGLAPVGIGLIGSAGVVLARGVDTNAWQWGLSIAACTLLVLNRVGPALAIGAGGLTAFLLR